MSDVIVISKLGIGIIVLALLMCANTVLMTLIVFDDLPTSIGEAIVAFGGWLWWVFLLGAAVGQI